MRNPGGYGLVYGPEGSALRLRNGRRETIARNGTFETDTFTCKHCETVVDVAPKQDPADTGGLCKICMGLICKHCVGGPCIPWEKKMEIMEARERLWQAAREA